jgi:hypothetical protein
MVALKTPHFKLGKLVSTPGAAFHMHWLRLRNPP